MVKVYLSLKSAARFSWFNRSWSPENHNSSFIVEQFSLY
jgi:hypothetical protein